MPALQAAMLLGNQETVQAFIECVIASGLPGAEQIELLAARKASSDVPVLGKAMRSGRLAPLNAYLEGIAQHSALNVRDRAVLLSKADNKGVRALAHGLVHGTPEAVSAVVGWIASQDFSTNDRRKLLLATDWKSTPALGSCGA